MTRQAKRKGKCVEGATSAYFVHKSHKFVKKWRFYILTLIVHRNANFLHYPASISLPWSQIKELRQKCGCSTPSSSFYQYPTLFNTRHFKQNRISDETNMHELPVSNRSLCQILYSKSKQLTHKSFNYITSFQKSDKREEENKILKTPFIPICRNLIRTIVRNRLNLIFPLNPTPSNSTHKPHSFISS